MSRCRWLALWLALCLAPAADAEDNSLCRKGWVATQENHPEQALDLYRECLAKGELTPASAAIAERNVGVLLYGKGEHAAAAEAFGRAIAAKPADVWRDHQNRAYAWRAAGEPRKALADFDETLALKPDEPKALYGRGLTYETLGRQFDAYADYTRASALDPDDARVRDRLDDYQGFGLDRVAAFGGEGFERIDDSYAIGSPVRAVKLGAILESKVSCLATGADAGAESAHADAESLRRGGRYEFSGGKIEVVLPRLDGIETLDVHVHLNDLSRGVRDDYLVFGGPEPRAAVLVTTLAKRMRSSLEVHRAVLDQVEELGAAFPRGDLLVRDLDGPWGPVVEVLARNRAGGGLCFPTSVWVRAPDDAPTMGVTRWIHREEVLIELALIVPLPKGLPPAQHAAHARARMDELMGAVTIRE